MKIGIIIQARIGSTRLPNKVMLELSGKKILWHVVERCKKTGNEVIVATSTNKENDAIENFCRENNYLCFRGSEDDVLNRYYEAAKKYKLDYIIRITADDPLISPEVINQLIENHLREKADYFSNTLTRTFPRGLDVEMFSFKTLEKANALAKTKPEREHVTSFIYNHPEMFKIGSMTAEGKLNRPGFRLCIDTEKDFKLLKIIYEFFYKNNIISIQEVIDFLDKNPELAEMNKESEIEQLKRNINGNIK